MGWITHDYKCECGWLDTKMHKRDAVPDEVACEECGLMAPKQLMINITRASYPDGYDRWKNVKELRALNKAERQAKKEGRADDVSKLRQEKKVLGDASRRDKKAANIVKVKE